MNKTQFGRLELQTFILLNSVFKVDSHLGESDFSYIYKIKDRHGQYHAAKFLKEEWQSSKPYLIKEEARRLEMVSGHANIVKFHDFIEDRILIMEFFGDGNLQQVRRNRRLFTEEIRTVRDEIADALDYGHQLGVIHRDVKAANILVESQTKNLLEQKIKLIDYGLGSRYESEKNPEFIFGTKGHLAPELAAGELTSPETDLYALGATLFFMGTASKYRKVLPMEKNYLQSELMSSDLSEEIKESIQKLLSDDPLERRNGLKRTFWQKLTKLLQN